MRIHLVSLFLLIGMYSWAQSGLRHMHYNLTLYGNPFGCEPAQNDPSLKDIWMDVITDHVMPDIITVNEMRDMDVWADRLLDEALNTDGDAFWERAELMDGFSGQSILNACYFRSDRFVLHSQEAIYFAPDNTLLLRPVDFYTFYPLIQAGASDTTFFTIVVAHLAASDAGERDDQTAAAMDRIAELGAGNFIFTGDLNMDGANENAFQNLVDDIPSLSFIDPVDVPVIWSSNSFTAEYHTQSTRSSDTNSGCFVGGGLDDRFDITLLSPSIWNGTQGMIYQSGSYDVIGNAGGDFNTDLTVNGNDEVSSFVASALYEMSDHLPLVSDYIFDTPSSVIDVRQENPVFFWDGSLVRWKLGLPLFQEIRLYDITGRRIAHVYSPSDQQWLLPTSLNSGVYLLEGIDTEGQRMLQRIYFQ